jgi:hypothetical protein
VVRLVVKWLKSKKCVKGTRSSVWIFVRSEPRALISGTINPVAFASY